ARGVGGVGGPPPPVVVVVPPLPEPVVEPPLPVVPPVAGSPPLHAAPAPTAVSSKSAINELLETRRGFMEKLLLNAAVIALGVELAGADEDLGARLDAGEVLPPLD